MPICDAAGRRSRTSYPQILVDIVVKFTGSWTPPFLAKKTAHMACMHTTPLSPLAGFCTDCGAPLTIPIPAEQFTLAERHNPESVVLLNGGAAFTFGSELKIVDFERGHVRSVKLPISVTGEAVFTDGYWVARTAGTIVALDLIALLQGEPSETQTLAKVSMQSRFAIENGRAWGVANTDRPILMRIHGCHITEFDVFPKSAGGWSLEVSGSTLWAVNAADHILLGIDVDNGRVKSTLQLPGRILKAAPANQSCFVLSERLGRTVLHRYDDGGFAAESDLFGSPTWIAASKSGSSYIYGDGHALFTGGKDAPPRSVRYRGNVFVGEYSGEQAIALAHSGNSNELLFISSENISRTILLQGKPNLSVFRVRGNRVVLSNGEELKIINISG